MERELKEETGLDLAALQPVLVSEQAVPGIRVCLLVFSIPDEVAAKPGDGIAQVAALPVTHSVADGAES